MNDSQDFKAINLKELIGIIKKRKWFLIVPLIIIVGISYGTTYFLKPKYQSSTIVWIDKPSNVSRELRNLIGSNRQIRESRDEQQRKLLALQTEITSHSFLKQLIQDLKLDDDPEITRKAAKARESTPEYSLEQLKYNLLVEKLRKQIKVSFYGLDQIKITVESENPVLCRDMAKRLTEIMEQEKTKYEMEKILDNQSFTDLQLQKTEYYYQLAIDSLNAAQARLTKLQLPENISSESNRMDILASLDKIKLEIGDYNKELSSLQEKLKKLKLTKARLKYTDTVVELRTTIDGLITTYANMMEKYLWNNQNIINVNIRLNNNIKLLEQAIASAVNAQYASYPSNQLAILKRNFIVKENIDILTSKKSRLKQTLDKIDERINSIPKLQSEISELQNKVENARHYRDAFRSEEATTGILSERAKERTKYKVIEPAEIPLAPFWPNKPKIIIIGLVMGLIVGGAFIFIVEMLDNSFKRIEDVERELGIPVIATIPKIDKLMIKK